MTVLIDKRGRRIEVRSPAPVTGLKTAIPGAYQTAAGYWTVPLSIESCKLLRERYGRRLRVGSELRRWAHGVVQSRKYMAELAASDDAVLENLPTAAPKLYRAMNKRKYQRVGARFIADNMATLEADDPGLGKTLMAMGGILEAGIPGPYLIVAPKTAAHTTWKREIIRWLPHEHKAVVLPELRYQREHVIRLTRYGPHTWLIVHPEICLVEGWWQCECGTSTVEGNKQQRALKCGHIKNNRTKHVLKPSYPKLFDIQWGAVVVDESHESLIRRKGTPTQRRRGLDMLKLRGDGMKIAMSGSPWDSKPHQLWGTLNWLDPTQYSAFHRWAELYWQKGGYTGYEIGEFRKDREPMLWDSLGAIALRRTKAEVAPDLPPKMYMGTPLDAADSDSPVGVWLPMDPKQQRAYEEMERLSIAELDSGRLEATTALAELTRLKQLACAYGDITTRQVKITCTVMPCRECRRHGWHLENRYSYTPRLPSNKFSWIVENLEEWGYPKNPITKVVIASWYTGILGVFQESLEKHFKRKPNKPLCSSITGKIQSAKRRARIIEEFNRDDGPQIMLLNVKAGGMSLTIDTADRMIFISQTRNPVSREMQTEDRIHRVSNPRQCMYYYLHSEGTVDVGTAIDNEEAKRGTHRLLDGRRGVEFTRRIIDLSHQPLGKRR